MDDTQVASTPAATGSTPVERPTFSSMDWSEATESAPVTPSTPEQPAAATVPPSAESTATPGEPPKERWPDILDNARKKEREQFYQRYGLTDKDDPQRLKQERDLMLAFQQNPIGVLEFLKPQWLQHPEIGPALNAWAANHLRSLKARGGEGAAAEPEPQPDVPIQLDNGQVVQLYSAQQLAKRDAWREQQLMGKFKAELSPLQERAQKADQQAAIAEAQTQANQYADQIVGKISKLPGYTENLEKLREAVSHGIDLRDAYVDIVVPTLEGRAQQKAVQQVEQTLKQRAAASTANPSAPAGTTGARPKSFRDKSLVW